jgi:GTP cyclohydrolase II
MPTSSQSPCAGGESATQCVTLAAKATLPTRYGTFTSYAYRVATGEAEHLALVMGDVGGQASVLTRLHSECLTGDVLGSYRCDCGEQLDLALRYIAAEGRGVLLYLRGHEGRGIGLSNKIRAYAL